MKLKLQKIVGRLQKLHPKEIDLSLVRVKNLCTKLGEPQDYVNCIQVCGTNGKFSTIQAVRAILKEGNYKVFIDSELFDGSMTYGELIISGETNEEVFFSTYVCHPSMANNELSGPILIADSIEKPGNLGTMIRTARSFDITNIISSDGVTDFFNPNVIRSSIGHIFNINIFSEKSEKIISDLKKLNYEIISLDPDSANSIRSYKPKKNYALVIGSEQYGISEIWKDNASKILKIDTENKVDSLNASGAAAIAMWEFYKNCE